MKQNEEPNQKAEYYRISALNSLKIFTNSSFCQMKSYNVPPPLVLQVLNSIAWILVGRFPDLQMSPASCSPKALTWNSSKLMLRNVQLFVKKLQQLSQPKAILEIPDQNVQKAKKICFDVINLNEESLKNISLVCWGIFKWLRNILYYRDLIINS